MRSFLTVFLTLSLIFVVSCAALKQEEIDPWLTTISGAKPAEIEITGKWRDSTGTGTMTWGEGYLHQEQNKVRGVMGYYNIITLKELSQGKWFILFFWLVTKSIIQPVWKISKIYLLDIILGPAIRNRKRVMKHLS